MKKLIITKFVTTVIQHNLIVFLFSTLVLFISFCQRVDLYKFAEEYQNQQSDPQQKYFFYAVKKDNQNKVIFSISDGANYYKEYFIVTDATASMPTCTVLYNNTLLVKVSDTMYVYTLHENGIEMINQVALKDQYNNTIQVTYPLFGFNNTVYCISSTTGAGLFKYDNFNNYWVNIRSNLSIYSSPRTVTRVGNILLFESDKTGGAYIINVFDLSSSLLTEKFRPFESIFLHKVDNNFYLGYISSPGDSTIHKIEESSSSQIAPSLPNIALYAYAADFNNKLWAAAADANDSLYTKIATIENGQWVIKASTNTMIQYLTSLPYYPKLIAFSPTKLVLFTMHYPTTKYLFVFDIQTNTIVQLTEDIFPGIQYIMYVCTKDRD